MHRPALNRRPGVPAALYAGHATVLLAAPVLSCTRNWRFPRVRSRILQ